MSRIQINKRDAAGEFELAYDGCLVERGEDYICVDAVFALPDRDLGYIVLRRGDRFREWFYRDRRYNIFRVSEGISGALKGWYCNITRPPQIGESQVAADDLCLDVFVYPDGEKLLLDEAEFAALRLGDDERELSWRAAREIMAMVDRRAPPFDEIPMLIPDRDG